MISDCECVFVPRAATIMLNDLTAGRFYFNILFLLLLLRPVSLSLFLTVSPTPSPNCYPLFFSLVHTVRHSPPHIQLFKSLLVSDLFFPSTLKIKTFFGSTLLPSTYLALHLMGVHSVLVFSFPSIYIVGFYLIVYQRHCKERAKSVSATGLMDAKNC